MISRILRQPRRNTTSSITHSCCPDAMSITPAMQHFLGAKNFIVIGSVLTDRSRWDNKVLRWYLDRKFPVKPYKPGSTGEAESLPLLPTLDGLDLTDTSISIIINPIRSYPIIQSLFAEPTKAPRGVWFQPGAGDSDEIKGFVKSAGLEGKVVLGGPCVLRDGDEVLRSLTSEKAKV